MSLSKRSISNVWQSSEYASGLYILRKFINVSRALIKHLWSGFLGEYLISKSSWPLLQKVQYQKFDSVRNTHIKYSELFNFSVLLGVFQLY